MTWAEIVACTLAFGASLAVWEIVDRRRAARRGEVQHEDQGAPEPEPA
jgi:hypothetical protein